MIAYWVRLIVHWHSASTVTMTLSQTSLSQNPIWTTWTESQWSISSLSVRCVGNQRSTCILKRVLQSWRRKTGRTYSTWWPNLQILWSQIDQQARFWCKRNWNWYGIWNWMMGRLVTSDHATVFFSFAYSSLVWALLHSPPLTSLYHLTLLTCTVRLDIWIITFVSWSIWDNLSTLKLLKHAYDYWNILSLRDLCLIFGCWE